jgi:hypothetical protein
MKEDFNINYYANLVHFMICLLVNRAKITNLEPCADKFSLVSNEALARDIASRAYYTALLSTRDKLIAEGMIEDRNHVDHSFVKKKLKNRYKTLLSELKQMREAGDYTTKDHFGFPHTIKRATYIPLRLEAVMKEFLSATPNQLTP